MSSINPLNRQDIPELEPFLSATEKRMGFVPNSQLVMAYKPNPQFSREIRAKR